MATLTIKLKADAYYTTEALEQLAVELAETDADIEDGKKHTLSFVGEHYTATVVATPGT